MPRIRTWHRVAHDFNRDAEVGELRDRFADWMGYVWLEMLAIADRHDGRIKGKPDRIAADLAYVSRRNRPRLSSNSIRNAMQFMVECGWIVIETDAILIVKYAKYRGTREHIEIPKEKRIESLQDKTRREEIRQDKYPPISPPSGDSQPEMTADEFLESWNEICASDGLPAIKREDLSNGRRRKINSRLRKHPTVEFWGRVFNGIIASDFLMGKKGEWKATFDWIIKNDENPLKVVEGTYG